MPARKNYFPQLTQMPTGMWSKIVSWSPIQSSVRTCCSSTLLPQYEHDAYVFPATMINSFVLARNESDDADGASVGVLGYDHIPRPVFRGDAHQVVVVGIGEDVFILQFGF